MSISQLHHVWYDSRKASGVKHKSHRCSEKGELLMKLKQVICTVVIVMAVVLTLLSLGYGFLRDIFPIRTVQILYSLECKHKTVLNRLDGIDLNFFVIVDGRKVYSSPDFAPNWKVDFKERLAWDKSGTVVVLEVIGRRLFGYDTKKGRPLSDSELLSVEYAPEPALWEYGFEGEWPGGDTNTRTSTGTSPLPK